MLDGRFWFLLNLSDCLLEILVGSTTDFAGSGVDFFFFLIEFGIATLPDFNSSKYLFDF